MTRRKFKKLIKAPFKDIVKIMGRDTTGLFICILADMLNDFTKDGDRYLRSFKLTLNDFFEYKYNFETQELEK